MPDYLEEKELVGVITIKESEYQDLINKASKVCSFKEDLESVREYFSKTLKRVEMDATKFEEICQKLVVGNLFTTLYDATCMEKMSEERKTLNKTRAMIIIYMMMYGQSQKANYFQVSLSRTLQEFGINEQGLASLKNLGIAAHPRTVKTAAKAADSSHLSNLTSFFEDVIRKNQLLIMFIDDYHNIHCKHRPGDKVQTQVVHTTTLLVKVFPGIEAVERNENLNPLSKDPADERILLKALKEGMHLLSKSFAEVMPDWITAKYFDPEAQRHRLMIHDY